MLVRVNGRINPPPDKNLFSCCSAIELIGMNRRADMLISSICILSARFSSGKDKHIDIEPRSSSIFISVLGGKYLSVLSRSIREEKIKLTSRELLINLLHSVKASERLAPSILISDSLKSSLQYCDRRDEDFVALEIDNFLFR